MGSVTPWSGPPVTGGLGREEPAEVFPQTGLFQRAAAVVVDSGGAMSHAAIVAREYGIRVVAANVGRSHFCGHFAHHLQISAVGWSWRTSFFKLNLATRLLDLFLLLSESIHQHEAKPIRFIPST